VSESTRENVLAVLRNEGLALINRRTLKTVTLSPEHGMELEAAFDSPIGGPPGWLQNAMGSIGVNLTTSDNWSRIITLRPMSRFDFRRIAWEVTGRCNVRCVHCYLDDKTQPGIPLADRMRLLDRLVEIGGLWLQLTGGEALSDPHFEETYRAAWERGFLISVSTNGLLLSSWIDLFRALPPKRIAVSLYGGSNGTYAAMTGETRQGFDRVAGSIRLAAAAGIRLRVSIIATKLNSHDIESMESLLKEIRVPFHVYTRLSPSLRSNPSPMEQMANIGRPATFFRESSRCAGGVFALHIHPSGKASPCKHLPGISADLLSEDDDALHALSDHPGRRAPSPRCASCRAASQCTTCAPILALYEKAGAIPAYVCATYPGNGQILAEGGITG